MRSNSRIFVLISFWLLTITVTSQVVAADDPTKVFASYQKALAANDGKAALALLTERESERVLFEIAFVTGMSDDGKLLTKHTDPEREQAWRKQHGPPKKENTGNYIAATLKDREAFFAEGLTVLKSEPADREPLRDVKVNGDRARGVVTRYIHSIQMEGGKRVERREPYDSAIYFSKTDGAWKIDSPTPAEAKADARRAERGE